MCCFPLLRGQRELAHPILIDAKRSSALRSRLGDDESSGTASSSASSSRLRVPVTAAPLRASSSASAAACCARGLLGECEGMPPAAGGAGEARCAPPGAPSSSTGRLSELRRGHALGRASGRAASEACERAFAASEVAQRQLGVLGSGWQRRSRPARAAPWRCLCAEQEARWRQARAGGACQLPPSPLSARSRRDGTKTHPSPTRRHPADFT